MLNQKQSMEQLLDVYVFSHDSKIVLVLVTVPYLL